MKLVILQYFYQLSEQLRGVSITKHLSLSVSDCNAIMKEVSVI